MEIKTDAKTGVDVKLRQGATLTASWYEGEGLIATEHAAAMLGVAAHGSSRTTTLRAFHRDEYERILAKLG
jgi:hypothetical protein